MLNRNSICVSDWSDILFWRETQKKI